MGSSGSTDPDEVDDLIVQREESLLTLTLNRPHAANALSPVLVERMIDELSDLDGIRACVIRGNGKHFCAGFDLSDLESIGDSELLWRFLRIEHLLQSVHHANVPILALAHGQTVGAGADLFVACWQRVASSDSQFRMPGWNFELALGTRRLTGLLGQYNAVDMLIDTRKVSASEARSMGLVTQVEEPDSWGELIKRHGERAAALPAYSSTRMLELSRVDTRDADIAAIVHTAGRPGLQKRVLAYRDQVLAARKPTR